MKNTKVITSTLVAFILLFVVSVSLVSATPLLAPSFAPSGTSATITYQGYLDDFGTPANGLFDMTFALYDDPTAGTERWSESQTDVQVTDALFSVPLGSETAFGATLFSTYPSLYLEISVEGDTLAPRQPLTSVPYAMFAYDVPDGSGSGLDADLLDGQEGSYYLNWSNLTGIPAGFADGVDNNTTYSSGTGLVLSGTTFRISTTYQLPQSCADGQVAKWDDTASIWECGDDTGTDTLALLSCADGQVAKWNDTASIWECGDDVDTDTDTDTLAGLSCADGQVAKWNDTTAVWECDNDTGIDADTLTLLSCADGQVAKWNDAAAVWECSDDIDTDTDTLALLSCADGQTAKWNDTASIWECGDDTDTVAGLSCADGQVAKWNDTASAWECGDDTNSPYAQTVVVSPVGTATQNGTALLGALAGITDASATNPYLLKIEPGIYNLGTTQLTMKEYVDIEGSGELVTKITSQVGGPGSGTIKGKHNAELRFLTVENTNSAAAIGIKNDDGTAPRLRHLTILVKNGANSYGIFNVNPGPTPLIMTDLFITVSGTSTSMGIYNQYMSTVPYSSSALIDNVNIVVSGSGDNSGIYNREISGAAVNGTMTMTGVSITCMGGNNCQGVQLSREGSGTYSFAIQQSVIKASGGTTANYGVQNTDTTLTVDNSVLSAAGGPTNYSIQNNGSSSTEVTATRLVGATSGSGIVITDADTLAGLSCADGQVAKWNDTASAWECGDDANSPYARTVVVSPVGTATENGTALLTALDGITDSSPTNPYLLKVEPGVYDIGTTALVMKEYVDIEGSGESVTKIAAQVDSSSSGTILGANNAELRFLTVENTLGGSGFAVGIYNNAASPRLTHLTVNVSGAQNNTGVRNAPSSSPVMSHMTIIVSGGTSGNGAVGVFNSNPVVDTPLVMNDLTIKVSDTTGANSIGIYNETNHTLPNDTGDHTVVMTNLDITVSGDNRSVGIINWVTSGSGILTPKLQNTVVAAMGTEISEGVLNWWVGDVSIYQSVIEASGGTTENYGVKNTDTTLVVSNSVLSAAGGTTNYSIENNGSSSTEVTATRLVGATSGSGIVITDTDTLASLSCADGQIAKWNDTASVWECGDDTGTDTLALLSCADGQVAKWNDIASAWECGDDTDTDTDTLASLSCADGQVAKWNDTASAWECSDDIDSPYAKTVVVSPVGTATQNGVALVDALAGITDASATNPYLLKIEPGIYDLGAAALLMKQYVDIEGSGELITKITSHRDSSTSGTIVGTDNAELRFLTVENIGAASVANAIYNNGFSPSLKHLTVIASGATNSRGIFNTGGGSPVIADLNIEVSGAGDNRGIVSQGPLVMADLDINVSGGANCIGVDLGTQPGVQATVANSTINIHACTGSTGILVGPTPGGLIIQDANIYATSMHDSVAVYADNDEVTIYDSVLSATDGSSTNFSLYGSATVKVANSQLIGTVEPSPLYTCFGAYDENFTALDATCH